MSPSVHRVPRHPRKIVHDGGARAHDAVEERRLADVGPADEGEPRKVAQRGDWDRGDIRILFCFDNIPLLQLFVVQRRRDGGSRRVERGALRRRRERDRVTVRRGQQGAWRRQEGDRAAVADEGAAKRRTRHDRPTNHHSSARRHHLRWPSAGLRGTCSCSGPGWRPPGRPRSRKEEAGRGLDAAACSSLTSPFLLLPYPLHTWAGSVRPALARNWVRTVRRSVARLPPCGGGRRLALVVARDAAGVSNVARGTTGERRRRWPQAGGMAAGGAGAAPRLSPAPEAGAGSRCAQPRRSKTDVAPTRANAAQRPATAAVAGPNALLLSFSLTWVDT